MWRGGEPDRSEFLRSRLCACRSPLKAGGDYRATGRVVRDRGHRVRPGYPDRYRSPRTLWRIAPDYWHAATRADRSCGLPYPVGGTLAYLEGFESAGFRIIARFRLSAPRLLPDHRGHGV